MSYDQWKIFLLGAQLGAFTSAVICALAGCMAMTALIGVPIALFAIPIAILSGRHQTIIS